MLLLGAIFIATFLVVWAVRRAWRIHKKVAEILDLDSSQSEVAMLEEWYSLEAEEDA